MVILTRSILDLDFLVRLGSKLIKSHNNLRGLIKIFKYKNFKLKYKIKIKIKQHTREFLKYLYINIEVK